MKYSPVLSPLSVENKPGFFAIEFVVRPLLYSLQMDPSASPEHSRVVRADRQTGYSDAWPPGMQAENSKLLKEDAFGRVSLDIRGKRPVVTRDLRSSSLWLRFIARHLMAREAAALVRLDGIAGVPRLISHDRHTLERTWLEGFAMHQSQPRDIRYFRAAARLLRQLHRHNIAHNDLAKEPNWLVAPDGTPAIVDYQLALYAPARGRLFRVLAREDLRHLLKHKRTYCPGSLTTREKRILATPAPISRIWMKAGKPVYLFVTRRLLNWADREGAGDR